ncbi:MAG: BrnT family toxin [Candidatus Kerfeldbacteria bacterium]|nr:BrnT family toxin [Candidatus Kerfeldbacteria bacterium]
MRIIYGWESFDWDEGNQTKNWSKHAVSIAECEQVFFNEPLVIYPDTEHSVVEERFYALGQTDQERPLFIVFTIRDNQRIRIISARPMNKQERYYYQTYYEKT